MGLDLDASRACKMRIGSLDTGSALPQREGVSEGQWVSDTAKPAERQCPLQMVFSVLSLRMSKNTLGAAPLKVGAKRKSISLNLKSLKYLQMPGPNSHLPHGAVKREEISLDEI